MEASSPLTLGDVLYADPQITSVPEREWLALVRAMAAGERSALRTLFEKSYPLVFSYLMLRTADRRVAENLILEVFDLLWCEAPIFDGTSAPVLGWIMRHARISAHAHASAAASAQHGSDLTAMNPGNDSHARLQNALGSLTADEREAIDAVLIQGLLYSEVAERQGKAIGSIKKTISSGMAKLRDQLATGSEA